MTYIVRQPQPYINIMRAVEYQGALSPIDFQDITATHRNTLEHILSEAQKKSTGLEQLRALESINQAGIANIQLSQVLNAMSTSIGFLTKRPINVFEQLLPNVNILHNYFSLLEQLATGATKEVFAKLHRFFAQALLRSARETYAQAMHYLYYKNESVANDYIAIAQALLFRLKDTDPLVQRLYQEYDKHHPTSFKREIQQLGIYATGGR
jgi:hypothetical protein